ncbi:multidrug transporter MATE [Clostridiales bacterium COT073_COT-073]|nr:multidrug transporter MATE [Clostridiales bacterium COT073_COT-073]
MMTDKGVMMITKIFFKHVIPSMLAFAFSGIYVIIDGIFVGRNTGDIGLAAVNINYPIAALMQALGTGIGMAGGIWISIKRGQKKSNEESSFLGNSLFLLLISALVLMVSLLLTYPYVLTILGAKGELLKPSEDYLKIIIYGTIFQVLATGFIPLVRNYNGVILAMIAMIAGLITNTVLDYVFIVLFPWGTAGAAAATVIGQAMTLILLLPFFFLPKPLLSWQDLIPQWQITKQILPVARSPFGMTLIPNLIVIILNKSAIYYGEIVAVSAYAIISYVIYIVQLFLQGIGDGAQPLISRYYGAENKVALRKIRFLSYSMSFFVGLLSALALYFSRKQLPILFGSSPKVALMYEQALIYFLIGILFVSILRVCISYLYAVNQSFSASLLIYGEPVLLMSLILFLLPPFLGLNGVWLSVPVSELIMMFLSLFYVKKAIKK